MRKIITNKNYKKTTQFKDLFVKENVKIDGCYHEASLNRDLNNDINLYIRLEEMSDSIEIIVENVLNEVSYTQLFIIDFGTILNNLNDKESETIVIGEFIGNNVLQCIQENDIEFTANQYGISSEWLESHDKIIFNISYNISDNGKGYLKFFRLREQDNEERVIEDEKEQLKQAINDIL